MVPQNAEFDVNEMVETSWNLCGRTYGTGRAWAAVELPDPVSFAVAVDYARLTPPDDDARRWTRACSWDREACYLLLRCCCLD